MLFSLLKHYLDLYISDTALKVSRSLTLCTVSLLLYVMVLKTISPGGGAWASLMLFLKNWERMHKVMDVLPLCHKVAYEPLMVVEGS